MMYVSPTDHDLQLYRIDKLAIAQGCKHVLRRATPICLAGAPIRAPLIVGENQAQAETVSELRSSTAALDKPMS